MSAVQTNAATAVGELIVAALYLAPSEAREGALRQAAERLDDWQPALLALESHGVLGLARRNLDCAQARVPAAAATKLVERHAALREEDLCFRLTLVRFLEEAATAGIEVTLLKGAALALDLYPEPALRSQADLDLLIDERHIDRAIACGASVGLVLDERSFPVWWYRRAHFHLKLRPGLPILREVELHWALHHPARLLRPELSDLNARRVAADVGELRTFTLDPLDRLLHLVTHLAGHAEHAPGPSDREHLLSIAATPAHPLRLKWILDVRAEVERLGGNLGVAELIARAAEWNAHDQLRWCLAWIDSALGFLPEASNRVGELLGLLQHAAIDERKFRHAPTFRDGPLAAFDFRPEALALLPRWVWPPAGYFARVGRSRGGLTLRRAAHAARVSASVLATALALPAALAGRRLARSRRRRARQDARAPERVLDVTARWRMLGREDPRGR